MSKITATQLVDCFRRYCAEKWGYVWGLNGELYTQSLALLGEQAQHVQMAQPRHMLDGGNYSFGVHPKPKKKQNMRKRKVQTMKINWKQKLTSRKFWAAIIGFITAILVAFGVNDLTIEQIVALIAAASTLIAYIIGEGMVDAARLKTEGKDENNE